MHCQQQSGSKPGWPQATPAGLRPMQQQAYQQDQASPYSNDAYGYGFLYPPPLRERQHNHLAPGQPNTWPSARHSAPAPAPAPYQADWNYSFNSTNLQQQHIAPAQFDNSFTGNSVQAGFIAGYGGNSIVGPSEPEPHPDADRLKAVKDLPAAFHPIFSYRYFNPVQSECFDTALGSDINMVSLSCMRVGLHSVLSGSCGSPKAVFLGQTWCMLEPYCSCKPPAALDKRLVLANVQEW